MNNEKERRKAFMKYTKEQLISLYLQKRFEYDLMEHLFADAKKEAAIERRALRLACEELMGDQEFESADDKEYALCESVYAYLTMAKNELKNEKCEILEVESV